MRTFLALMLCIASLSTTLAAEKNYTRQEDVVYGRKHGMALTLVMAGCLMALAAAVLYPARSRS